MYLFYLWSSGSHPSGVHFCPTITTSGWQTWVFFGENVAPACPIQCIIWCTSLACSCKGIIIFSITTLTVYLFSLNKNMFCVIFFYVTGVTSVLEFYTFFIQFSWTFLDCSWIISEFLCIIYTALISCLFNFNVTLTSFGWCHNIKNLD